jgi:hypothetical protein
MLNKFDAIRAAISMILIALAMNSLNHQGNRSISSETNNAKVEKLIKDLSGK